MIYIEIAHILRKTLYYPGNPSSQLRYYDAELKSCKASSHYVSVDHWMNVKAPQVSENKLPSCFIWKVKFRLLNTSGHFYAKFKTFTDSDPQLIDQHFYTKLDNDLDRHTLNDIRKSDTTYRH